MHLHEKGMLVGVQKCPMFLRKNLVIFSVPLNMLGNAFQAHDPGPRDWYPLLPQLAVHGRVATKIYIPKMNENEQVLQPIVMFTYHNTSNQFLEFSGN